MALALGACAGSEAPGADPGAESAAHSPAPTGEPPRATAGEPAPHAGGWTRLRSGLHLRRAAVLPSPELPVHAWLVRMDPSLHELRVLVGPSGGDDAGMRLASAVASESGALAVVNASYFDPAGRPLGLLVADGRRLAGPNARGWAWAALEGESLILRVASAPVPAGVTQAVQAGPLLVRDGAPIPLSSIQPARRAFLGTDGTGRVVLGATTGPLMLAELAAFLARSEEQGGAGLAAAMNLDGGSSAQLHVSEEASPLKVPGVPVPVFLAVIARDGEGALRPDGDP